MNKKLALACLAMLPLTGCGMMQSYDQYLDNNQRTYERTQAIKDAQNQVLVAQLQVQSAKQQAQVNIEIAKGKAEAQDIQTRSLKPLFVQQELVDAIADGKVQTLIIPSNAMLPINLQNSIQGEDNGSSPTPGH